MTLRFRASPLVLVVIGLMLLSGCSGPGPGRELSVEEAPEGPNSLRIGYSNAGDYARVRTDALGQEITFAHGQGRGEPVSTVRDVNRTIYRESWIRVGHLEMDRFGRDFEAVTFESRVTNTKPSEGARGVYQSLETFELATHDSLFIEYDSSTFRWIRECLVPIGIMCDFRSGTEVTMRRIYAQTPIASDSWYSLEGKVLKLGQTLSLNKTYTFGDDVYIAYANYTALREETIQGERTFVVQPSQAWVQVGGDISSQPTSPPEAGQQLPKPTHLQWYSARTVNTVKEITKFPFRHQGQVYWFNTTSVLEELKPGSGPIPWGRGTPLSKVSHLPGEAPVPPAGYLGAFTDSGLTYDLGEAWRAVEDDPTLVGLTTYKQSHPQARAFAAKYYPDPERSIYSWDFWVGTPSDEPVVIRSQMRVLPSPLPPVITNMVTESEGRSSRMRALDLSLVEPATLSALKDTMAVYRKVFPSQADPYVAVMLAADEGWSFADGEFNLEIHVPERGEAGFGYEFWSSKSSMAFDLSSGAIRGINESFLFEAYTFLSLPDRPAAEAQDAAIATPIHLAPDVVPGSPFARWRFDGRTVVAL
jgi:hypothetical protein